MKITLPQGPKSHEKFWGIILCIPFVFALVFIFMLVYQGSTKPILAVANQFQPGDGWLLESERVEPPRIICLGGVNCPSVHNSWVKRKDISLEEFKELLEVYNWSLRVTGDCLVPINVTGTKGSVCEANGEIEDYSVRIMLSKSSSYVNETNIELYIN